MSNLLSFILSLFLVIPTLLFSTDLFALSAIRGEIESRATTLGLQISMRGGVDEQLINSLKEENIDFVCLGICDGLESGQVVKYQIIKYYQPLFISTNQFSVVAQRSAMIGYY